MAYINAVKPPLSRRLTSAPLASSAFVAPKHPLICAYIKGVRPSAFGGPLGLAPLSSSFCVISPAQQSLPADLSKGLQPSLLTAFVSAPACSNTSAISLRPPPDARSKG